MTTTRRFAATALLLILAAGCGAGHAQEPPRPLSGSTNPTAVPSSPSTSSAPSSAVTATAEHRETSSRRGTEVASTTQVPPRTVPATTNAPVTTGPAATTESPATTAKTYRNCAELNRDYPHGVGRTGAHDNAAKGKKPVTNFTVDDDVYAANTSRDADDDGVACEQ